MHTSLYTHTHTPTHPSLLKLIEPVRNVARPKTIFADLLFLCFNRKRQSTKSTSAEISLGQCSVFNHILEDRMIRDSGICLVDNSILPLGRICEQ